MKKKVLTEQAIYSDIVKLPKGYEVNSLEMCQNIFKCFYKNNNAVFCKSWDQLNRYIIENVQLRHQIKLINKKTWGNIFTPNEEYTCLSPVDPVDLKNSPDFTCIYGINTEECYVTIYYDDNRRKGRSFKMPLKHNSFIMFPSTNIYTISNNQKSSLNFVQTITFELF